MTSAPVGAGVYRLDAGRRKSVPPGSRVCFNMTSRPVRIPTPSVAPRDRPGEPMRTRAAAAVLGLIPLCGLAAAEDWPGWRGPRADGTASDSGYPLHWGRTENVRWKTTIPGTGHSSPVVSNGRVFVTSCVEPEKKRMLYCVDRAGGKILWERCVLVAELEKKHGENSWASSTPAADGGRVYVSFLDRPRMRVYCYDSAGNKLWEASPGEFPSQP